MNKDEQQQQPPQLDSKKKNPKLINELVQKIERLPKGYRQKSQASVESQSTFAH